jgi:hypothetical protein
MIGIARFGIPANPFGRLLSAARPQLARSVKWGRLLGSARRNGPSRSVRWGCAAALTT